MPTCIEGELFAHTCQYCGHKQTEPRTKHSPFMFTQYRCSSCQRPLDDLDWDLLADERLPKPDQAF